MVWVTRKRMAVRHGARSEHPQITNQHVIGCNPHFPHISTNYSNIKFDDYTSLLFNISDRDKLYLYINGKEQGNQRFGPALV